MATFSKHFCIGQSALETRAFLVMCRVFMEYVSFLKKTYLQICVRISKERRTTTTLVVYRPVAFLHRKRSPIHGVFFPSHAQIRFPSPEHLSFNLFLSISKTRVLLRLLPCWNINRGPPPTSAFSLRCTQVQNDSKPCWLTPGRGAETCWCDHAPHWFLQDGFVCTVLH